MTLHDLETLRGNKYMRRPGRANTQGLALYLLAVCVCGAFQQRFGQPNAREATRQKYDGFSDTLYFQVCFLVYKRQSGLIPAVVACNCTLCCGLSQFGSKAGHLRSSKSPQFNNKIFDVVIIHTCFA